MNCPRCDANVPVPKQSGAATCPGCGISIGFFMADGGEATVISHLRITNYREAKIRPLTWRNRLFG